jgi:hypothetical protein
MVTALSVATVVALVLLTVGYRGRRVDDHPLCRRCGFDLTGTPAASTLCSECGADLRAAGAVRRGHRTRRPLPLALGWGLSLLCLVTAGVWAYGRATHVAWITYEPLFMLRWNLQAAGTRDAAFAEIARRLSAGRLSEADVAPVADLLLAWHADATHPWNLAWGDFLEDAFDRKRLSAARWQQFLSRAIGATFEAGPQAKRGGKLLLWTSSDTSRFISGTHVKAGPGPRFEIDVSGEVQFGDYRQPARFTRGRQPLYGAFPSVGTTLEPGDLWRSIPDGPATIQVRSTLELTDSLGSVTAHGTRDVQLSVQCVPSGTRLLWVNHDLAVKQRILDSLTIFSTNVPLKSGHHTIRLPGPTRLADSDMDFRADNPPIRAAFHAELVQGPARWPFQYPITLHPTDRGVAIGMSLDRTRPPSTPLHEGPAELVLTPILDEPDSGAPLEMFGDELRVPVVLIAP